MDINKNEVSVACGQHYKDTMLNETKVSEHLLYMSASPCAQVQVVTFVLPKVRGDLKQLASKGSFR